MDSEAISLLANVAVELHFPAEEEDWGIPLLQDIREQFLNLTMNIRAILLVLISISPRYQNIMTSIGGESFNKTTYPALSDWAKALFLKWHRQDPVSKKETDRNNAVEVYQKNRNPFIDHPELAEYVWGSKVGEPWSLSSGIENLKIEFSISPVPAKDFLNIKTNEYDLTCRIFNIQGQELMKTAIDGNTSLPVSDLNNGMYLLQLEKEGEKTIQKFVVSR